MYPEVKTYLDTIEAIEDDHDKIREKYRQARDADRITRFELTNAIDGAVHITQIDAKLAWLALGEASDDKLVRYIVENHHENRSDALIILRELPLTREGLLKLRNNHNWCEDFDEYLIKAEEAGVVPWSTEITEARRDMKAWLLDNVTSSVTFAHRVMTRMDEFIAAEAAEIANRVEDEMDAITEDAEADVIAEEQQAEIEAEFAEQATENEAGENEDVFTFPQCELRF